MKKHRMRVQVDQAILAWVRAEAARRGCSESQVVRDALLLAMQVVPRKNFTLRQLADKARAATAVGGAAHD